MAPIRVAIIGLSATAVTGWASAAHLPYLLSARGRERFRIVALLNSSVAAAHAAIAAFGLPAGEVRAYGDPDDLAADLDVDLVVCSTRVDKHLPTAAAAARAGKAVFVEWPLAHSVAAAAELAAAAAARPATRSVVGVQGRFAPAVRSIAGVLASGRIGKVLSVEVRAAGGTNDRVVMPLSLGYFTEFAIGGNPFTIGFGHMWDFVQSAVGEATDVRGRVQLQRPEVQLRDPKTGAIVRTVTSNVPDLILATAKLASSPTVQEGATLAVRFRRGQPFPGDPPLVWTVNGEKGELRLQSTGGTSLHANVYEFGSVKIEVHDFATDKVEEVEWAWEPWQEQLPFAARSVGALYEAFAEGDESRYATFADALRRHEQLATITSEWFPRI